MPTVAPRAKRQYQAVFSAGPIVQRTSSRHYTYAWQVALRNEFSGRVWYKCGFSNSEKLANSCSKSEASFWKGADHEVIGIEVVPAVDVTIE